MKPWMLVLALVILTALGALAWTAFSTGPEPPPLPPLPNIPTITPPKVIERKVVVMREQVWEEVRSMDTVGLAHRARDRVLSASRDVCGGNAAD